MALYNMKPSRWSTTGWSYETWPFLLISTSCMWCQSHRWVTATICPKCITIYTARGSRERRDKIIPEFRGFTYCNYSLRGALGQPKRGTFYIIKSDVMDWWIGLLHSVCVQNTHTIYTSGYAGSKWLNRCNGVDLAPSRISLALLKLVNLKIRKNTACT